MVIEQKYVDIALEYTDAKREAQGVVFGETAMEKFLQTLSDISKEKKYTENQFFEAEHWITFHNAVVDVLQDATKYATKQDEDFLKKVDAKEYVLSAFDYILALSSKALGSPDISLVTFPDKISRNMEEIINSKPDSQISLSDVYEKQRRVNAKDLEGRIDTMISMLEGREQTPENFGALYAEYKALTKRQENHGSLWRLFHRKENTARNELIRKMEECLNNQVPGILENATMTAAEAVKAAEMAITQKNTASANKQYDRNVANVFGYEEYVKNPDLLKNRNQVERISLGDQLVMDTDIENTAKKPESKEETLVVAQTVIEEPVVEEPVVEEPVVEEPVIEEPVVEDPVIEEPVVEDPVIEEPVVEEPVVEEPVVEEPVVEEPVVEEPVVEEPKVEEPKVEEPKVEEPKVEEPVVEEPVVEEPVVEEPVVEEPVVEEPKVEEPVVEEPVVEEPVVEEPKIEELVVEEPVVEEPKVEEPKVEEPVVEEPKVEEPVVEEPVIEEPKVEEPVVEEPVIEEPVIEEPKVEEPVIEEPKVEEPKVEEPKVEEPKVEEPVVEEPVVEEPEIGESDPEVQPKLTYVKNQFEHENKRPYGKDTRPPIRPGRIFLKNQELSNANVIAESDLEDDVDVEEELNAAEEPALDTEAMLEELALEFDEDALIEAAAKSAEDKVKGAKKRAEDARKKASNERRQRTKAEYAEHMERRAEFLKEAAIETKAFSGGKYKNSLFQVPVVSSFEEAFDAAADDEQLTAKMKAEIGDILRSNDMCDEDVFDDDVDQIFNLVDNIRDNYVPMGEFGAKNSMDEYVKQMYYAVNNVLDDADCQFRRSPDPETQIIQTQKLTDVLLRNYPPVSNSKGQLDKYAHNYMIHNTALLEFALGLAGMLEADNKVKLYGARLAREDQKKTETDPGAVPYKGGSPIASIRNRIAMEERMQAIANTPKSEMTGPMREQMTILELSEKISGKAVSEKIKERETLVKTNAKE